MLIILCAQITIFCIQDNNVCAEVKSYYFVLYKYYLNESLSSVGVD